MLQSIQKLIAVQKKDSLTPTIGRYDSKTLKRQLVMIRLTNFAFNHFIAGQRASFLTLLFALLCVTAQAQVGIGTETPDETAQLEVVSSNKGFLTPRMEESDRTGIDFPATGLLVYQTDGDAGFYYFNGSDWVKLAVAGPAASTIIPYASGLPVSLTTVLGGLANTGAIIGFGNSANGILLAGTNIDLTGAEGVLLNMAFTTPKDGVITGLSGTFSTTVGISLLGASVQIKAEVFVAPENSNLFERRGTVNIGTPLSNTISVGEMRTGSDNLNIPILKGQRVLVAFSVDQVAGIDVATTVAGYASAGLAIE